MKKTVAALMAAVMMVGLVGCSALGGGKFKSASNKVINAAKKACDAEEADKKQKKELTGDFDATDDVFEDGCYYTFDEDELEDTDFGFDDIDTDDVKNATAVVKSEDGSAFVCLVIELEDKDAAEDMFDEFMEMTEDMDEKELKSAAKNSDLEYGINDEKDDEYALMFVSDDYNMASGFYFKLEGNIVYAVVYSGKPDTDLLDEFYDFMSQAKLQDMEDLLGSSDDDDDDDDDDDEDDDEV